MEKNYDMSNMPPKIRNILDKCADKAKGSTMHSKHCACFEKNGRIYEFTLNDYCGINHSRINKFSVHAEEKILLKYSKKGRTKFNLYIVRISTDGSLLNSEPCNECSKIIRNSSHMVSKVIYPISSDKITVKRPADIYSNHISIGNRNRLGKII